METYSTRSKRRDEDLGDNLETNDKRNPLSILTHSLREFDTQNSLFWVPRKVVSFVFPRRNNGSRGRTKLLPSGLDIMCIVLQQQTETYQKLIRS